MVSEHKIGRFTWLDMDCPAQKEIDAATERFKISLTAAKDMASPTPRPKVHNFGDHLYAVVHIPVFKHSHSGEESSQEIDFLVGENFLITVRYDSIDAVNTFAKAIEVEDAIGRHHLRHPFFGLMREMHKSVFDELAWSEDWITEIERKIFSGKEKEMVIALSRASRNILNFRRITGPHRSILSWISDAARENWNKEFNIEMKSLWNNFIQISEIIENQKNLLEELRETNNSLLSTKENEIMKVLTIMAFVTFPLSLIAAIFGMNTSNLPIVGGPNDFWVVMGIMGMTTTFMFIFFKIKKWL